MALRPNWYESDRGRGGYGGIQPASWSGFRWIVTLNVGAFLVQLLVPDVLEGIGSLRAWWVDASAMPVGDSVPGRFNVFFPVQLVTYAFLHTTQGLGHIFWNMLFLWFFGPELEAEYGRRGFLRLYLSGAVFGGLVQWAYWLATGDFGNVIGASGAVYTVMILFALKYPNRVLLLFFVLPVPIWAIAVFRVIGDIATLVNASATLTAVLVHLGGAAVGLVWFRSGDVLQQWGQRRRRDKAVRAFQEESTDRREMDRILGKIQATGLSSLDRVERQFLEKRSRELRDRGG